MRISSDKSLWKFPYISPKRSTQSHLPVAQETSMSSPVSLVRVLGFPWDWGQGQSSVMNQLTGADGPGVQRRQSSKSWSLTGICEMPSLSDRKWYKAWEGRAHRFRTLHSPWVHLQADEPLSPTSSRPSPLGGCSAQLSSSTKESHPWLSPDTSQVTLGSFLCNNSIFTHSSGPSSLLWAVVTALWLIC